MSKSSESNRNGSFEVWYAARHFDRMLFPDSRDADYAKLHGRFVRCLLPEGLTLVGEALEADEDACAIILTDTNYVDQHLTSWIQLGVANEAWAGMGRELNRTLEQGEDVEEARRQALALIVPLYVQTIEGGLRDSISLLRYLKAVGNGEGLSWYEARFGPKKPRSERIRLHEVLRRAARDFGDGTTSLGFLARTLHGEREIDAAGSRPPKLSEVRNALAHCDYRFVSDDPSAVILGLKHQDVRLEVAHMLRIIAVQMDAYYCLNATNNILLRGIGLTVGDDTWRYFFTREELEASHFES